MQHIIYIFDKCHIDFMNVHSIYKTQPPKQSWYYDHDLIVQNAQNMRHVESENNNK